MMSTPSCWSRAGALAIILAMVPASASVAQAHKGKHHVAKAPAARPAVAVAPQPRPMQQKPATPSRSQEVVRHNTTNTPNPSNESLVSSLHSTVTPLAQVEHDYNGRRGRAMREIHAAIKLLDSRANAGNTGLAQSGGVGGANTDFRAGTGPRVPQATSDARLREAQQSLRDIESRMNTSGINPHQFTRARASVQNAIRELNLALIDR